MSLKLSVIIVTYNRRNDLKECLDSIFSMRELPHEVIVVDSFSNDETDKLVRGYPVKYVRIPEKSMVKARNVGLRYATGNIIAYVDDDAIVSKEWSTHILEPYSDEKVCGVGGRVLPYGINELNYDTTTLHKQIVGKVLKNGFIITNFDIPTSQSIEVDTFIGTNMSFRRVLLLKIGGFDERFVGNCFREETDTCLRLRRRGCRLIYAPKALVWHKWKNKKLSIKHIYWTARNHTYFYFKNVKPVITHISPFVQGLLALRNSKYPKRMGIDINIHPFAYPFALIGTAVGFFFALAKRD